MNLTAAAGPTSAAMLTSEKTTTLLPQFIFDHEELAHCENFSLYLNCQTQFVEEYGYDKYISCMQALGKADYSEYKKQMDASLVIFGYLLNIVCLSGIIGNILSYVIMRSKEFKDSTTGIYLQVLMFVDSLYLVANFIHYGLLTGAGVGKWYITPFPAYSRIYIFYILIDLFRNCSVLITVAVTVERYIYVCHSLKAAKWCTRRRSKATVAFMISLACIYEIPRLLIQKVAKIESEGCGPIYMPIPLSYIPYETETALGYLGAALFVFVPFVSLTLLTWQLLLAVRKSRVFRKSMRVKSRDSRTKTAEMRRSSSETNTTVILLSVVVAFIACSTPSTCLYIVRLTGIKGDEWLLTHGGATFNYLSRLLLNINSAINVILFCFFGKKFRKVFHRVFIRCECTGRKSYQAVSQVTHTYSQSITTPTAANHPLHTQNKSEQGTSRSPHGREELDTHQGEELQSPDGCM